MKIHRRLKEQKRTPNPLSMGTDEQRHLALKGTCILIGLVAILYRFENTRLKMQENM